VNVQPGHLKEAYSSGDLDGHYAVRKSRRRILWVDIKSLERWKKQRLETMQTLWTCAEVERETGFAKLTLQEFCRTGLLQPFTAPRGSTIRGLCFDRVSVARLYRLTSQAAHSARTEIDSPVVTLRDAARLYLGRIRLASFLASAINRQEKAWEANPKAHNEVRLCELRFPLRKILSWKRDQHTADYRGN
jgi:hypothetical protein